MVAFGTVGCHRKIASVPPPPRQVQSAALATPARPTIAFFAADPATIDHGSATTLRWSVANATDVRITPSVGAVRDNGSERISPATDTTYTLSAKGPGGAADASTSIVVRTVAASNTPDAATKARIEDLLRRIQDAYFDYNKRTLRPDAETALQANVKTLTDILRLYPDYKLTVEGNCDERGSEEYNLALGDARARAARDYLVALGIPGNQLMVISYGKDHPVCTEHDEACWQRNRRAHVLRSKSRRRGRRQAASSVSDAARAALHREPDDGLVADASSSSLWSCRWFAH